MSGQTSKKTSSTNFETQSHLNNIFIIPYMDLEWILEELA